MAADLIVDGSANRPPESPLRTGCGDLPGRILPSSRFHIASLTRKRSNSVLKPIRTPWLSEKAGVCFSVDRPLPLLNGPTQR
jgi:hypothetical protein